MKKFLLGKRTVTPPRVAGVFFAIAIFAPILWMALDREPAYIFEKVELQPLTVKQGGELEVTFTIERYRPACGAGSIYRELKEESTGKLHVYDPVQRVFPPNPIDKKFSRRIRLPEGITPGHVTYRGYACYSCNLVQSWLRWPVCTTTPSVVFTVQPPE